MDLADGPLYWAILVFAGAACGFLNTLASSGSAVSLPLLLPAAGDRVSLELVHLAWQYTASWRAG